MEQLIAARVRELSVGHAVGCRNLQVFPLTGGGLAAAPYLTLDDATEKGLFSIGEVSESGSVSHVMVDNRAPVPVLLLDGEELIGAKQNRIVNLTILVAARSTLVIPVSCVEAGRWHHRTAAFAPAPRTHYAAARAAKAAHVSLSMREHGGREADQSAIWEDISEKAARMEVPSPTGAMADMFEQHAGSIEEYVEAIAPVPGQVGAVFAIDGRVRGLECCDTEETFRKILPKLVRSYAIDAIETNGADHAPTPGAKAGQLRDAVAGAKVSVFPAVGVGNDVRIEGNGLAGGALIADGRVVHLAAFVQARRATRIRRPHDLVVE